MIALIGLALAAQGEASMDSATLAHELDRLATTARILYVAAHPDDENTRLLAYLANGRHLATTYLSMTRGGGGQNLIGTEQSELLDVVRTQELLAARRIDGARQRFTRMRDFGYSKTAAETLSVWGKDEALLDVVRVIRSFQPDVIITRFDEKPPNHGHHTASAILAREAFEAAADPARFKDAGAPWQATRLVHNLTPWREGPPPTGAIELDVGGYDAGFGESYGEIAARSRSQHKSQGFGVPGERGPLIERFVLVSGAKGAELLDGVKLGWERYGAAGQSFATALAKARAALDRDHPERALPALIEASRALPASNDLRVREAREQLDEIIAGCAGLFVRATAPRASAVPGSTVAVSLEVVLRAPAEISLERVELPFGASIDEKTRLKLGEKKTISRVVAVPVDAPVSPLNDPEAARPLEAQVSLKIGDRPLTLRRPVLFGWTDRVHGERLRSFTVAPLATVTPARQAVMLNGGRSALVLLQVRAGGDRVEGKVTLALPDGWRCDPSVESVALKKEGDERTVRFTVTPPAGAKAIEVTPRIDDRPALRRDLIDHPHIPVQLVLQPARVKLVPIALSVPKGIIGYVDGSGDTVADDLAHVGATVERLSDAQLESADLSRYAAIILGIRAYNTRPALRGTQARLMRYVEQGGNVVVQYNTNSRWDVLDAPLGPYPLEIGRDRVTDEGAEMVASDPKHPLLRTPNALVPADYDGWVQERGLYFAGKYDAKYTPIYRIADPDEKPLTGALIVARHGKGQHIYTGLAFFRQLPAGVPGAYRLLANLIARR